MRYLALFLLISLAYSCTINKNIMFKTKLDYEFDLPKDTVNEGYRISPNDQIIMRLYTNGGARLLALTADDEATRLLLQNDIFYIVNQNGFVDLPEVGEVFIQGYTLKEAELMLEELYSSLYNSPYVFINVTNNRVIIFPGSGGDARVIPLVNNNTTVIEALALAGGVAVRGNASKVKLIRRIPDSDPDVYLMDLSTIEGIQYAGMSVQANDIIYVEPVPEIAGEVLRDLSPFVTIITSLALLYGVLGGF